MDWILILFALGFVAWGIGYQPKKSSAIITDDTPNSDTNDRDESQQKIIRDAIRNEIRAAIDRHVDAVCVLQMLARLDGNTAEAERNVIFDFLKRQGERLEPQHRAWFYSWAASEWQRTAGNEEIDYLVAKLRETPLQYRIDIAAAATAIVATGGAPKKREAETLEKLRGLIVV